MTRRSCTIYATGIVCAHLLIIGIALVLGQVFQTLIHNRLKKELTLAEGSRVIESWKNPPSDVYMQYFFFNVTNPEVFLAGGKAAVTQIGPYTYRGSQFFAQDPNSINNTKDHCPNNNFWGVPPRENVTYLENGTKLFALNPKSFVFVPEMSSGDPEVDLVRTINIPFVATVNEMKNYNFMVRTIMSIWIKSMGVELFITRTVHEMLWGFKDPLMTKLHSLKPEVDEYFGLMYKKNGTHEGEFVFLTGEQNYLDYGKIDTWNGLRKMTWWSSNQSNMINGTDGSAFHPLLSKNELLYIFAADLCRSIHLGYVEDVVVEGISAYRRSSDGRAGQSPGQPRQRWLLRTCKRLSEQGVLKVSVCREVEADALGQPLVRSDEDPATCKPQHAGLCSYRRLVPHFYQADQKYIDAIEGMRPSKEAHETYLDLNPTTGIPVRACKRAQLNVLLNRVSGFPTTRNLTQTIFPIMFVNESFVIDPNSAGQMRTLLTVVTVVSNFPLFIVGLGAILLVVFVILICRSRQKRNAVKRIEFSEAFRSFPNAKEDTAYTQVSSKPEEQRDGHVTVASQSLRNGSYISMSQVETPEC